MTFCAICHITDQDPAVTRTTSIPQAMGIAFRRKRRLPPPHIPIQIQHRFAKGFARSWRTCVTAMKFRPCPAAAPLLRHFFSLFLFPLLLSHCHAAHDHDYSYSEDGSQSTEYARPRGGVNYIGGNVVVGQGRGPRGHESADAGKGQYLYGEIQSADRYYLYQSELEQAPIARARTNEPVKLSEIMARLLCDSLNRQARGEGEATLLLDGRRIFSAPVSGELCNILPSDVLDLFPSNLPYLPTRRPTRRQTQYPTRSPTRRPTRTPTRRPSVRPEAPPTRAPSMAPQSSAPTQFEPAFAYCYERDGQGICIKDVGHGICSIEIEGSPCSCCNYDLTTYVFQGYDCGNVPGWTKFGSICYESLGGPSVPNAITATFRPTSAPTRRPTSAPTRRPTRQPIRYSPPTHPPTAEMTSGCFPQSGHTVCTTDLGDGFCSISIDGVDCLCCNVGITGAIISNDCSNVQGWGYFGECNVREVDEGRGGDEEQGPVGMPENNGSGGGEYGYCYLDKNGANICFTDQGDNSCAMYVDDHRCDCCEYDSSLRITGYDCTNLPTWGAEGLCGGKYADGYKPQVPGSYSNMHAPHDDERRMKENTNQKILNESVGTDIRFINILRSIRGD